MDQDRDALGRLGYAQELLRRMGGFSSFAVSFSIISVLTGCIAGYSDALASGGPRALGFGWPFVSLGTLIVALAMAELASAFPTAGALYHWSALLGGPTYGWLTAAINITGQIAIVAAIDFACANELAATLRMGPSAAYALVIAIVASHAVVNALSVWLVARLNDFSATVHIVGVLLIVSALFIVRVQPIGFLAVPFTARSDGDVNAGLVSGLVLSMFTFTGYDASAHMAEETHDPARRTPWGIVTSVAVSAVAGYLLLAAITLCIRDLPRAASDSHAALEVLRDTLGVHAGDGAMALALVAMWFCGLSSLTSASRTLFAFGRDGGLPGSAYLGRVDPRTSTPLVAIVVVAGASLALVLGLAPLSSAVFDAAAKTSTMALYVSYALPIAAGVIARHDGRWRTMGPFQLGRLGVMIGVLAVLWSAFVLVVCALPPGRTPAILLAGVLVVLFVLHRAFARGRFKGPRVNLDTLERRA
jgi:amino acid transporter